MIVALILDVVTLAGDVVSSTAAYLPSLEACQSFGADLATAAERFESFEYDCRVVSQERLTLD